MSVSSERFRVVGDPAIVPTGVLSVVRCR